MRSARQGNATRDLISAAALVVGVAGLAFGVYECRARGVSDAYAERCRAEATTLRDQLRVAAEHLDSHAADAPHLLASVSARMDVASAVCFPVRSTKDMDVIAQLVQGVAEASSADAVRANADRFASAWDRSTIGGSWHGDPE